MFVLLSRLWCTGNSKHCLFCVLSLLAHTLYLIEFKLKRIFVFERCGLVYLAERFLERNVMAFTYVFIQILQISENDNSRQGRRLGEQPGQWSGTPSARCLGNKKRRKRDVHVSWYGAEYE